MNTKYTVIRPDGTEQTHQIRLPAAPTLQTLRSLIGPHLNGGDLEQVGVLHNGKGIPDGLYARAKHLAKNPTAVEVATWKRRAIEAESKLRAYDSNLLADLFVDPKPSELVLTKCRLCDQLQADLTAQDQRIDLLEQQVQLADHWLEFASFNSVGEPVEHTQDMRDDFRKQMIAAVFPDLESRPEERGTPATEPCSGCGTLGWTGACSRCIPY
nr:hypothetical protein [Pseudomonas sp. Marseille-Q3773]